MSESDLSKIKAAPYYRVKTYSSIDSTSLEAKRQARAGESAGLWVVADEQTAGKGRLGRGWQSLKGNLFASLLLFPACDISKNPELSFVAAVAVAATLRQFTGARVTCKWPNDVLIEGKKAAGILLETESTGNPQKPWVVVGIGINVAASPEEADFPTTHLNAHLTEKVDRNAVFEVLSHKFSDALTRWARDGFGPIRTLWLNQAHGREKPIRIETDKKILEGAFIGLSATGALLLEDFQGTVHEILSGTVLKD